MEKRERKGGGKETEPQVNFSISLISCDVDSMVKKDVQLNVRTNDSPSQIMQSDPLSSQFRQGHLTLSPAAILGYVCC